MGEQIKVGTKILEVKAKNYIGVPLIGWGLFENSKNTYIEEVSILTQGNKDYAPKSCYADLFNVRKIVVEKKNAREYIVKLNGGDAGSSYTCFWYFKDYVLIKRKVFDNEFPKLFFEETIYVSKPMRG